MLEKPAMQSNPASSTSSWSSYFTWAAKAFALLGVGSIGTGMVRYLLQDNTETTSTSHTIPLSLLPQEKENTGDLLSFSADGTQPLVDTHIAVSLLETAKLMQEDFDDAIHISSTDASIPVTEESMHFILTPVGTIPVQVINADAIDTYVLSPVNHALHAFSDLALHPAMGFATSYLLNAHLNAIPRVFAGCLGAFSSLHVFHVEAVSVSSTRSLTPSQSFSRTVTISLTPSRSLTSSQSSTRTSTISLTSSKSITATTSITLSPSVTLSITLSPSPSAAPFLIVNPLPDQVIDINTPYALKIDGREVFGSDVQAIFVSGLPSWMSASYVSLGNYDTPGIATRLVVQNNIAYIADGLGGLQIVNVTVPSNPTLLSTYATAAPLTRLVMNGTTAYLGTGVAGLQVLSVNNPRAPLLLGSYANFFNNPLTDISFNNDQIYALAGNSLYGLDVSNPSNVISLVNVPTLPSSTGNTVMVSDQLISVVSASGVYYYSKNAQAVCIPFGSYTIGYGISYTSANDVTVVGNIAYIGLGGHGLQIFDIVDPTNPTLLESYSAGYSSCFTSPYVCVNDVVVIGNTAYVAAGAGGLQIINVANPSNPILLGSYAIGYDSCQRFSPFMCANAVAVVGSIAYVAANGAGLQIINVTNPVNPTLLGSCCSTADGFDSVTVVGSTAYVAVGRTLQIINVINSTRPMLLGSYNSLGSYDYYDVAVVGGVAYIAAGGGGGLQIINVTNPRYPTLLGNYTTGYSFSGCPCSYSVTVIGSTAYMTVENGGLQIINVADLTKPILLENCITGYGGITSNDLRSIIVIGGTAYIAAGNNGLQIALISTFPFLSSAPIASVGKDIQTIGNITYVVEDSFLQLFNVQNPSNSILLASNAIEASAQRLLVTNSLAYVAEGNSGIQIFNVANPSSPALIGSNTAFNSANDISVSGSVMYVADGNTGLQILNLFLAQLQGLPNRLNIGNRYTIQVTAMNSAAQFVTDSFQITVAEFPVVFQPITPPQPFWAHNFFTVTIPAVTFSNPDINSNPLSYNATLSDSSALPSWINFNSNNLIFSGTTPYVNISTSWVVRLKATNTLGGYVSTTFPLIVNPAFLPTVTGSIPFQYAKVDQPFNYFVPQGMFADPNGNALLFSAHYANSTSLPTWLNFNPISATFSGLPHGGDIGNFTVIVTATDSIAGSVSTQFGMYVTYLPQQNGNIPAQVAGIGVPYQYTLNKNIFSSPGGNVLIYDVRRKDGLLLPPWLNFNSTSFVLSGTPNSTNAGTTTLQMSASDAYQGTVSTLFDLLVENFPTVNQIIPNQVAGISVPLTYTIPVTTFADSDGNTLSYQAALSNGLNLPNWLNWNPLLRQLTGTASSSDKGIQTIRITAADPFGGFTSTLFNLTIENFPTVANPIPTQLAGVNVTYLYTIPANTFADADGESLHLTLGSVLPVWLNWTAATTQLQGTPRAADIGITNVQITAMDPLGGFVTDVFTLRVKNFPTVNQLIPNQAAGINQAFYFTIPTATFRDAEGDILTYQAALSDGSVLPNWLNWNGLLQQLIGTPLASDRGTKTLRITATDPLGGFTFTTFNLTVENLPTVANPIPAQLVGVNNTYIYTIPTNTFADIDNEPLRLSVGSVLPTWLNWNISSAQLRGTPHATDVGMLSVQIIATDPLGGFVTNAFNLHVENFPTVNQVIANQLAGINQAFYFTLPGNTFVDIDGNALTYQASLASGNVLPNWLNWNALNQQLIGTPLVSDRGTQSIRITATDPFGGSVSTVFNLTVENFPSVQIPIPNQLAGVNVFFSYTIPANTFADVDGEPLSYQIQPTSGHALPEWLNWNALLKTLQGTPRSNNTGLLGLQVTATDPLGGFTTNTFTIRVENFPYVNQIIPNQAAGINQPFDYTVPSSTFIDVDHDTLTYQATLSSGINLPNWLNWDALFQQFTGTPLLSDLGVDNIRITATDPFGGFAQTFFNISVGNLPIVANPISNQLADVNVPFTYRMPLNTFAEAGDPSFTYQASLFSGDALPNWLTWDAVMRQLQGTPNVNQTGLYNLKITATDTASHSISDAFTLRVENFPQVNRLVPNKIAGINLPLSYTLPTDIFIDVDNEVLIYQATLASGVGLPNWLNWNPTTLQLTGTPLASDRGVDNIRITAVDPFGGSAATIFNITVENLPVLARPISDQLAGVNLFFNFTMPENTFTDADNEPLTYKINLLSGAQLPNWLNWTANIMHLQGVPQANDRGILNLQLTATDPLGAFVSDNFNLRVEYFPQFNHPISNQVAGVNLPFIFTLPANTFTNLEGDLLTYDARLLSGAALPNWMQWDSGTQKLKGTPQISDVGVNTIQVIATDPLGATASGSFQLSVVQLPILNHPITPPAFFKENKPLVFVISPDTFSDPNHLSLNYTATLNDGSSLPTWLFFNQDTLTFSGQPTSSDEGNLALQVIVTNSQGASTTAPFTFHIIPDSAPVIANPISNLVAEVGISFKFVVPDITFNDPNGDALTYSAQLSDGSPLPLWLSFRGNVFSGTPGGDDTNFYQIRVLPISLRASDGTLSTATAFNISVSGVSTGEKVVKIVSPILSVLGTGYGLYRKRALILNSCCKKRYQKLEDTAVVGESYSRQLETPIAQVSRVEARFQRNKFQTCVRFFKCQTNGMPGGALLPEWLSYDEATNTIHSKGDGPNETNIGTLLIQVRNTDGVIQEQFTLKVTSAEHALSEMTAPISPPAAIDDYDHRDRVWNDVPLQQLRRASEDEEAARAEPAGVEVDESPQVALRS